jgi:hypothetical protein
VETRSQNRMPRLASPTYSLAAGMIQKRNTVPNSYYSWGFTRSCFHICENLPRIPSRRRNFPHHEIPIQRK